MGCSAKATRFAKRCRAWLCQPLRRRSSQAPSPPPRPCLEAGPGVLTQTQTRMTSGWSAANGGARTRRRPHPGRAAAPKQQLPVAPCRWSCRSRLRRCVSTCAASWFLPISHTDPVCVAHQTRHKLRKQAEADDVDGPVRLPATAEEVLDRAVRTVFVGNLGAATTRKRLRQLFATCVNMLCLSLALCWLPSSLCCI